MKWAACLAITIVTILAINDISGRSGSRNGPRKLVGSITVAGNRSSGSCVPSNRIRRSVQREINDTYASLISVAHNSWTVDRAFSTMARGRIAIDSLDYRPFDLPYYFTDLEFSILFIFFRAVKLITVHYLLINFSMYGACRILRGVLSVSPGKQ